MGPLDDILLQSILRTDSNNKVLQKEDDKIEFKAKFDNGSKEAKAKYAKELAALHNYEGGYLIFGVDDTTKDLLGLSSFAEPDNADLSNDINTYFSPAIKFQSRLVKIDEKDVFVIYTEKRNSIPTVCIKSHQQELKESTIYWRYSAKSAPIHSGDLINLLNSLKGEDNKMLAEIAEKDFRHKVRPILQTRGRMHAGGTNLGFSILNEGERCHIGKMELIEGASLVNLVGLSNRPTLRKDDRYKIEGTVKGDNHPNGIEFKIKVIYHDEGNYGYESIIHWAKQTLRIKTEEL